MFHQFHRKVFTVALGLGLSLGLGMGLAVGPDITSDLVAKYDLANEDDSSAGGHHLINNGLVTFTPGKIGNAATFNGIDQSLTHVTTADLELSSAIDWTIALWAKLTSKATSSYIVSKIGEYQLAYHSGLDRFQAAAGDGGSVTDTHLGSPVVGAFYFIVVQFDVASQNVSISINNGTPDENQIPDVFAPGAADFILGSLDTGSALLTGQIDAVRIYKRKLSRPQIAALYNSGNGTES